MRAASHANVPSVFLDDSLTDPQAEASALFAFRREKRLEDLVRILMMNSRAVVGDDDPHARLM